MMIIAGLQKNSLIDFPGKVACVVFVSGCNFACPFCHNPELARGGYPQRIAPDQLDAFLKPRRRLLDGVVVTGGEPTLCSGLGDLCRRIHDLGLAVKLDTNGSRPDVLARLIEQHLVDHIAMDIKTALKRYTPDLATGQVRPALEESIRLLLAGKVDYEFRTTCVRPFVDEAIVATIGRTIRGARRYVLQPFHSSEMLRPDFFNETEPEIAAEEMARLTAAAAPWVDTCFVRQG